MVILGEVLLWYFSTIKSEETWLKILLPLASMAFYYLMYHFTKVKTYEFTVSFADSFYYLGFVYTLSALAFSVFYFDASQAHETIRIINNLGIALTTTLVGFFGRTWLINFLVHPGANKEASISYSLK